MRAQHTPKSFARGKKPKRLLDSIVIGDGLSVHLSVWLLLTFFAGIAVIILFVTLGGVALSYPLIFLFFYFFVVGGSYFNAVWQASMTPGLEKLDDPSFLFSAIGNAYLYMTDRRRWMLYVSLIGFFAGLLLGTPIGYIVVGRALSLNLLDANEALASWSVGVFLVFAMTATLNVFTSERHPKPMQRPSEPKKVCPQCGEKLWFHFSICPYCNSLLDEPTEDAKKEG